MNGPPVTRAGRHLDALLKNLFYCPACATWRTQKAAQATLRRAQRSSSRRHASTLSSHTAVNAQKRIAPRYQALYDALGDVRKKASAQVNLSRLQLALQGLESETPTTRVAILGLNVQDTARRLVRLLLADALEDEASWERELLVGNEDLSQGLVIRFGQPPNPSLQRPRLSIPVLYIPSSVLERNNMEILVSSISGLKPGELLQGAQTVPADAFLSPSIGTPTAFNGRQTTISQPVHNTLLVTKGMDQLLSAAELLASTDFAAIEDRNAVRLAVNLEDIKANDSEQVLILDVAKAEQGLAAIRRSVSEATTYEHKWVDSGMPAMSTWLTVVSAARSDGPIPKAVKDLISGLLTNALRNLEAQAALEAQSNAAKSLSMAARRNLDEAIEAFSRNAHEELQAGLAAAWSSRNWRKLAWYKLFWRVDDVGLIITDLVTNAWLPQTERAVFELCGRLSQAGISPMEAVPSQQQHEAFPTTEPRADGVAQTTPSVLLAHADLATQTPLHAVVTNKAGVAEIQMIPSPQPVPLSSSIATTRSRHLESAITDLTATAQQIVLKTVSITGLTAGLSALTYISLTPGSLYEAGTIVALGTAFALRRMQTDWLKATKALEGGLYEEGRDLIRRIVVRMRELVENASRVVEDELEVRSRKEAQDAITRARDELDRLEK
ncbi:hypothetical protein HRR83_005811 [Exophiala dermatitidis]|uniref:Mmc1 C-terminal domain-containing protein n=2 Tax=Exophiala dermatitidis TaxID=5970 RepID=H6BUW0_EXODN|nr:uncharacterized protein HMPREF1120_03089 [Exophiala dermatitidis NIH/UT8656]KAJ4508719.1 hypothetical protein HRR73_007386 [Exophiala dermatitidis]EHY54930.1 hypothetical protein HMPREF1120_03089 [Exophiala dermatitidis NIH/UT8656]KAJ4510966.1 hypothetical protein HRR75_005660 [Exophiala dermatitidis]KAJ4513368.1 hypothetical protein HRR74_006180 [Exophiala dermatitidis]KAJ4538080.1 hypothetical protein HRR77_007121 [Exophiala dermatitidis]